MCYGEWFNVFSALQSIGGYLGLFSAVYNLVYGKFRNRFFLKFLKNHLESNRPDVFENLSEKQSLEKVRYKFSHVGLSDLHDQVKELR